MNLQRTLTGVTLLTLLCLGFSVRLAVGQTQRQEARYLYLFSPDARFLKMEAETLKLVDVGNLWWMGITSVGGGIPDPRLQHILLKIYRASRLLGIENPTREQFDAATIAVLETSYAKGTERIGFLYQPDGSPTVLHPPSPSQSVTNGKLFDLNGARLFLTWDQNEPYQLSVVSYDAEKWYRPLARVKDFDVYQRSCLTSDKQRLCTSVIGEPKEVVCLDLNSKSLSRFSYEQVGGEHYFSKNIVASQDCFALILVIAEKPDFEAGRVQGNGTGPIRGQLYLYDIEKRTVRSQFEMNTYGTFHLLHQGRVILLNEETYALIRLPDGSTERRQKGVGLMRVYDSESGREMTTIRVPEESSLQLISPDQKRGYLVSPKRVTVLDLENWKVLQSAEVLFESSPYIALVGKAE